MCYTEGGDIENTGVQGPSNLSAAEVRLVQPEPGAMQQNLLECWIHSTLSWTADDPSVRIARVHLTVSYSASRLLEVASTIPLLLTAH